MYLLCVSPQKYSGSEVLPPSHVSGVETDSEVKRLLGRWQAVKPRTSWLQSLCSWLPHGDPCQGVRLVIPGMEANSTVKARLLPGQPWLKFYNHEPISKHFPHEGSCDCIGAHFQSLLMQIRFSGWAFTECFWRFPIVSNKGELKPKACHGGRPVSWHLAVHDITTHRAPPGAAPLDAAWVIGLAKPKTSPNDLFVCWGQDPGAKSLVFLKESKSIRDGFKRWCGAQNMWCPVDNRRRDAFRGARTDICWVPAWLRVSWASEEQLVGFYWTIRSSARNPGQDKGSNSHKVVCDHHSTALLPIWERMEQEGEGREKGRKERGI